MYEIGVKMMSEEQIGLYGNILLKIGQDLLQ